MFRRVIVPLLASMTFLAGCQAPPRTETLHYRGPDYAPARDGNWRVGTGLTHPQQIGLDYWPSHLALITLTPTRDGRVTDGAQMEMPVTEGQGHVRQVVSIGRQRIGLAATIRSDSRSARAQAVSVDIDLSDGHDVVRLRDQAVLQETANGGGQEVMARTVRLAGGLYALRVMVRPGPGSVSAAAQAMAGVTGAHGNPAWGNVMPMERHGGSLSDVMHGAGHASPDPDFHDPVDPDRGGFGPGLP